MRELTLDEALQLQTYQTALEGSRKTIEQVLELIEKREAVLAKQSSLTPARAHYPLPQGGIHR